MHLLKRRRATRKKLERTPPEGATGETEAFIVFTFLVLFFFVLAVPNCGSSKLDRIFRRGLVGVRVRRVRLEAALVLRSTWTDQVLALFVVVGTNLTTGFPPITGTNQVMVVCFSQTNWEWGHLNVPQRLYTSLSGS